MKAFTVACALLLSVFLSGSARATLFDRGSGLIYDDVLNITWLQDANYAKTSGFDADGLMTWANANTWADNLVFGGFSDWRLATISSTSPTTTATDCSTATAAACAASGNELGYMYYYNLTPAGDTAPTDFLTDLRGSQGPFTNIQGGYWSGTEFHTGGAWGFNFANGSQGLVSQGVLFAAWAVRPGDVASVPEPGAWLLMGVGFVGLVAARGWWGR